MSSQLPKALRQAVMERDGWSCRVCGAPATQVDHIFPESKGGGNEMENLQALCQAHNRAKSDKVITRGIYWDENYFPQGLKIS